MPSIQENLRNLIEQTLKDSSYVRFRSSYSGRGMYGESCIGIVGTENDCREALCELIQEVHDISVHADDTHFRESINILMSYHKDTMGYDVIFYWPTLSSNKISDH